MRDCRLVASADRLQLDHTPAPQFFEHRQVAVAREAGEVFERRLLGEADDSVIRRVRAQDDASVFIDGFLVIAQAGAVGRPDLADARARFRYHVGDAERSADLDQFASRYQNLAAFGQGVERNQNRRRAVVDHGGGFAAGQFAQHRLKPRSALPAPPRLQIVFEIAVTCDFVDGLEGATAQWRAAQVRVQRDAGRIDHALRTRSPTPVESGVQTALDLARKLLLRKTEDRGSAIEDRVIALKAILYPRSSILGPRFGADLPSDFGEDFAQTVAHRVAPGRCDQISQAVAAQQLVDRRQMT